MLEILKTNFLELLNLFVRKPWVGLVIIFLGTTVFFMNKWVESKDECQSKIDSLNTVTFNNLLEINKRRAELELEFKAKDSVYRAKLEESNRRLEEELKQLRDNVRYR